MNNIKKITIYFICCTSLFLGLLFDENSSGGAKIDHTYLIPFIENFSINFKNGFQLFIGQSFTLIHSPVFYLITGFFFKNYTKYFSCKNFISTFKLFYSIYFFFNY